MKVAPVSCIITSYNNSRTLSESVHSVLSQSMPVAEIIIADDESKDDSIGLIESLARRYSCITPIIRQSNSGVAANRDLAIRAASQNFITHLDGDDFFSSGKIRAEWLALGGRSDAVAYSHIARIDSSAFIRSTVLDPSSTVLTWEDALENILARNGPIPRDMLMSKALFERVGGFVHGVSMYEDWQFKIKLAMLGVEWICSGSLGTLYMQWPGTLSRADKERHTYWRSEIVRPLIPDLIRIMGKDKLTSILLEVFSNDIVSTLLGYDVELKKFSKRPHSLGRSLVARYRFLLKVNEIRNVLNAQVAKEKRK